MTLSSLIFFLLGSALFVGRNSIGREHSVGDIDEFLLNRHGNKVINVTAGNDTFSLSFEQSETRKSSDRVLNSALKFIRKPDNIVVTKEGLLHALRPRELGGRSGFSPHYQHMYENFMDLPDEAFSFKGPWNLSMTFSNILYERKEATCYGPYKPDGICGGGLENATMEKTSGRWSYQSQPIKIKALDRHSIHGPSDVTCNKIREVKGKAALFLSTIYFDHPSGNHFHWLGDGLLHLFAGLVDAGIIDPITNKITEVFTLFVLNPTRQYSIVPPNNGFKEYLRLLMSRCPVKRACKVEYINDLSPFSCIHFSEIHYVTEAVGMGHRNSLDVAPYLNPSVSSGRLKSIDTMNLTRTFPGNSRSFGFAPLLRRYFVSVAFCEQEPMRERCMNDSKRVTVPPPPDYFSRGPIIIINRSSNRHAKDKIHKGRNQGGLRKIFDVKPNVLQNPAISTSARSPLRGRVMEVDLSSMSVSSQIRLMNSAAGVVAIHGAGLGNIFWLQSDALVVEHAMLEFDSKQLTPYKLCDCLYYMAGPFQTLAALVDAGYANICLSRENMEYVESNDTELKPSDEMLNAPSGKELCDYEGGRYPWLFGISGIRMSKQEWETILLLKMRKMFVERLARRIGTSSSRHGRL